MSTTDPCTVCERLDHLDRLLVCLTDALRQGTEYRENDQLRKMVSAVKAAIAP